MGIPTSHAKQPFIYFVYQKHTQRASEYSSVPFIGNVYDCIQALGTKNNSNIPGQEWFEFLRNCLGFSDNGPSAPKWLLSNPRQPLIWTVDHHLRANLSSMLQPRVTREDMVMCVYDVMRSYIRIEYNLTKVMQYYLGPLYSHGLTLIPALISNHMASKVRDEITYLVPDINGYTIGVWE